MMGERLYVQVTLSLQEPASVLTLFRDLAPFASVSKISWRAIATEFLEVDEAYESE